MTQTLKKNLILKKKLRTFTIYSKFIIFFDVTNFLNIFLRPTYFGYAKIILPFRNYSIFWTDSGRWCTVRARAPMNGFETGHTIGITIMDAENRANKRCRRKRERPFFRTDLSLGRNVELFHNYNRHHSSVLPRRLNIFVYCVLVNTVRFFIESANGFYNNKLLGIDGWSDQY